MKPFKGNEQILLDMIQSITFHNNRISIWGNRYVKTWYGKKKKLWSKIEIISESNVCLQDKHGNNYKLVRLNENNK